MFIIMFLTLDYGYSQEKVMVAYYGKSIGSMHIDSTQLDKEMMGIIDDMTKQMNEMAQELEYKLLFTKTESLFSIVERLSQGKEGKLEMAANCSDGRGIKYTNLQTNERLLQQTPFEKLYLITAKCDDQKWELLNETKKIGQFNCFKAITVVNFRNSIRTFRKPVMVWYTTDIPFSHGPIGYGSLPGLIVELTYENSTYFLKKIELNPKEIYQIEKPVKGKKVTMEEYYDSQIEASKNISFGN